MAMTTQETRKTLKTVETLIAVLEQRQGTLDRDQLQVLRRLRGRRSTLRGLLAVREVERPKKIIQLALWRDGYMQPEELSPGASASAAG